MARRRHEFWRLLLHGCSGTCENLPSPTISKRNAHRALLQEPDGHAAGCPGDREGNGRRRSTANFIAHGQSLQRFSQRSAQNDANMVQSTMPMRTGAVSHRSPDFPERRFS